MWHLAKKLWKRLTTRVGVRPRLEPLDKLHPDDVRETTNHWSSLLYRTEFQPVVIEAGLERGVDVGGVSFRPDGQHPCVRAVKKGLRSDRRETAMRWCFERCRRFVRDGGEVEDGMIPLPNAPVPGDDTRPESVFPWSVVEEGAVPVDVGAEPEGDAGEWTDEFESLIDECAPTNFPEVTEEPEPIDAVGLVDADDRWRWMPATRRARARGAVYAACGYDGLPLRIHRVVAREHAPFWPAVTAGLYSVLEARRCFDRLFCQTPSPVVREWERARKTR